MHLYKKLYYIYTHHRNTYTYMTDEIGLNYYKPIRIYSAFLKKTRRHVKIIKTLCSLENTTLG